MSRVTKKQILEWIENPVTIAVRTMIDIERTDSVALKGLDAFRPFEPAKTQELLATLNGQVQAYDYVIEALEGGDVWELEDD